MTREEAIEVLRRLPIGLMDLSCEQKSDLTEALNIALAALRGPTREQVDRVLGSMWEFDVNSLEYDWRCVTCGTYTDIKTDFCPRCGAPMTGEAVDILLKRLEALKDGTKSDRQG